MFVTRYNFDKVHKETPEINTGVDCDVDSTTYISKERQICRMLEAGELYTDAIKALNSPLAYDDENLPGFDCSDIPGTGDDFIPSVDIPELAVGLHDKTAVRRNDENSVDNTTATEPTAQATAPSVATELSVEPKA